eukprot:GHVP01009220.1.p1 GENE.GHVP01009220.1~~GHVP01009220.1.p1  ORF type:complete len:495 (-),score=76.85 GHVP01009220.1:102-1586(-)
MEWTDKGKSAESLQKEVEKEEKELNLSPADSKDLSSLNEMEWTDKEKSAKSLLEETMKKEPRSGQDLSVKLTTKSYLDVERKEVDGKELQSLANGGVRAVVDKSKKGADVLCFVSKENEKLKIEISAPQILQKYEGDVLHYFKTRYIGRGLADFLKSENESTKLPGQFRTSFNCIDAEVHDKWEFPIAWKNTNLPNTHRPVLKSGFATGTDRYLFLYGKSAYEYIPIGSKKPLIHFVSPEQYFENLSESTKTTDRTEKNNAMSFCAKVRYFKNPKDDVDFAHISLIRHLKMALAQQERGKTRIRSDLSKFVERTDQLPSSFKNKFPSCFCPGVRDQRSTNKTHWRKTDFIGDFESPVLKSVKSKDRYLFLYGKSAYEYILSENGKPFIYFVSPEQFIRIRNGAVSGTSEIRDKQFFYRIFGSRNYGFKWNQFNPNDSVDFHLIQASEIQDANSEGSSHSSKNSSREQSVSRRRQCEFEPKVCTKKARYFWSELN